MDDDTTLVSFSSPAFEDQLSEMLQEGARRMIAAAIESELAEFMSRHAALREARGHQAVVRNGYQPAGHRGQD